MSRLRDGDDELRLAARIGARGFLDGRAQGLHRLIREAYLEACETGNGAFLRHTHERFARNREIGTRRAIEIADIRLDLGILT